MIEVIGFITISLATCNKQNTIAGNCNVEIAGENWHRSNRRYFENLISQDIATSDQQAQLYTMEQQLFTASAGNLPGSTLILSGDSLGGFDAAVEDVYQRFLTRNYKDLNLQRIPDYALGHQGMFEPSFTDSIRLVFEG